MNNINFKNSDCIFVECEDGSTYILYYNSWSLDYYGRYFIRSNAKYNIKTDKITFHKDELYNIKNERLATSKEEEKIFYAIEDKLMDLSLDEIYNKLPSTICAYREDGTQTECEFKVNKNLSEVIYEDVRCRYIAHEENDSKDGFADMLIWCIKNGYELDEGL